MQKRHPVDRGHRGPSGARALLGEAAESCTGALTALLRLHAYMHAILWPSIFTERVGATALTCLFPFSPQELSVQQFVQRFERRACRR